MDGNRPNMETTKLKTAPSSNRIRDRRILREHGITGLILDSQLLGDLFEDYAKEKAVEVRVKLGIFRKPSMLTLEDCDRIMNELGI